MIRTRALASISMVLAGAVFLPPATLPAENSVASAPPPHSAPFDQQSVWRTWKIYCDTCHFGPKARANLNLESLDLANLDEKGKTTRESVSERGGSRGACASRRRELVYLCGLRPLPVVDC